LLQELDSILDEHFGRASEGASCCDAERITPTDTDEEGEWESDDNDENRYEMTISNRVIDLVNGESESEIDAACSDDCRANSEEDEEISDDTFQCRCATQCLSKLSTDQIESHRLNVAEMEKNEKEMYIMGVLQPVTSATTWRGDRKRKRVTYSYNGEKICRTAFQHLFDIGRRTLTALTTHMHLNGKVPRIHGNKHRKPRHALRYAETKNCVDFLVRYADVNGLPQPAAPRGRDNEPPIYLPASLTKYAIHKEYKEECARQEIRCLGLTSFKGTWSQCVPHIKISTPRDDVCQKCELLRKKIKDAVSDRDKLDAGNAFTSHVTHAQEERVFYKESIAKALEETPKHREPGPVPPCSSELKTAHYTFDYCQQVGIPQHSRQMGPLYFMSTRKVQIFGFRDDGLPMQYNYLIDENQSIGEYMYNTNYYHLTDVK